MKQDRPGRTTRNESGSGGQYRLYFLEGSGDRFSYSHEFEAANDERAMDIAHSWLEGRRAELWCGTRKVTSWDRAG